MEEEEEEELQPTIVRKGEKIIQEESNKIGHIHVSSSVITATAGRLLCKAVIHTVGPKMGKGDKDTKLRKPIRSSLTLVSARKLKIYQHLVLVLEYLVFLKIDVDYPN